MTNQMHFSNTNGRGQSVEQADGVADLLSSIREDLIGMDLDPDLLSPSFVRNPPMQIPYSSHVPGTHPLQLFSTSEDDPWRPKDLKLPGNQNEWTIPNQGFTFPGEYRDKFSPSECDTLPDTVPMPSDSGYASHELPSLAGQFHPYMDLQQNWSQFSDQSPPSFVQPSQLNIRDLICETSHKVLKTNSEFKKHRLRHIKPHKCQVPGCSQIEGFPTLKDLARHLRSMHPQEQTSGNRYRCPVQSCARKEKLWPRADNFRAHLKRVHEQILTDEEVEQFVYCEPPVNVLPDPPNALNKAPEDVFLETLHVSSTTPRDVLPEYLRSSSNLPEDVSPEQLHPLGHSPQNVVPEPLNALSKHPEDVLTDTVELLATGRGFPQNTIKPSGYDPTDSGYGSMPSLSNNQESRESASNLPESETSAAKSDAGTVLSAATAMVSGIIQESLTDVCEAIYRELQPEVDPTRFMERVENLGELIKAFAIQLGLDQSNGMGPSIMYFVYKHHKDICALLKAMFMAEDEIDTNSRKDRSADMSLAEKMEMWHPESSSEHAPMQENILSVVDKGCQFEGVVDLEDDEPITTSELSVYSKVIFKSSAYRWLVSTLKQHASLSHGEPHAAMASDETRQTVLGHLQTGTISKKRPPRTSTAFFVLPGYWNTLKARLHCDIIPGTDVKLEDVVVLVASSETHVQLSTVGRYMRQVWQDSGISLLRGFQDLVNGNVNGDCVTVRGRDPLNIKIDSVDTEIRVMCNGPSYLISQCAAQLAWIYCALRCGSSHPVVCTPHLVKTDGAEFSVSYVEQTATERNVLAHVDTSAQLQPASIHETVGVWGFPTAWRPEGFSGVEIPLDLTYTSAHSFFQESENRLILNIGGAIAYFVEKKDEIWLWHLAPSPGDVCPCLHDGLEWSDRTAAPRRSGFYDLYRNRHIFSRCGQSRRSSHEWNAQSAQEEETYPNRYEKRTMSECPKLQSLSSESQAKHSTESDSIDTDMLSISSFSCDNEDTALELHGDIAAVVEIAAQYLFFSFQQSFVPTVAPCDGESTNNSQSHMPSSGQFSPKGSTNPGVNPRKRKENDQDEEDGDASRRNRRPAKQSRIEENSSEHKFACPFWKLDRAKYRSCLHAKLLSSSRVKQHLKRNHTPQFYCQFCYIIFKDGQAQEQHIVQRSCERLSGAKLDGVSPEQEHLLSRKPKSEVKLTEEQKWYQIWAIILPEHPLPRSPYIDSQLTDDLASFQEHWQMFGPEILERQIQSSGIFPYPTIAEAQLLRGVLARGLDLICESWMTAQQNTSVQVPITPAYTQEYSSRGALSSTTPSSSSAGASMNFRGNIHTNPTRRPIGQTGSAIADSSMFDQVGANTTSVSLGSMLPELDASATMQTHAPLRDSDDFFSVYDVTFPHESGHSAAEFEDILNWPNP